MSKRVTILIDEDIDQKLRLVQAKKIRHDKIGYSYSKTINDSLREFLK